MLTQSFVYAMSFCPLDFLLLCMFQGIIIVLRPSTMCDKKNLFGSCPRLGQNTLKFFLIDI